MCRLLAARAEGRGAAERLRELLPAFLEAARHDERLERYTGARSHCDGYGYVLVADWGGGWEVRYGRGDFYSRGLPREETCRLNLELLEDSVARLDSALDGASRAYLVLHARKASRYMPRGLLSAHPYMVPLAGGALGELFLAHNGGVDRERLAGEASVLPGLLERITDSRALAVWIARRIERGLGPLEALREGARYVRSAYVVALLILWRTSDGGVEPGLYYSNVLRPGLGRERPSHIIGRCSWKPGG